MAIRFSVWMFLAVFLTACSDSGKEKSVITTSADGVTFGNEYFGLAVTKPDGWYSQAPEDTMKLNSKGASLMAGDNQNMKAIIDDALKSSLPLFAFFQFEPGTPGKLNANIISVAENIEVLPGIKSGCDYLSHARTLLENAAMKVNVAEGCKTRTVNNAKLGYLDISMNLQGITVLQRLYSCVNKQHALSFTQTYFDDAGRAAVEEIVDSIHVDCE